MVSLEDIKDEIFDMIKPENLTKITLKDIIRSGMGHVFVSILIDVNGFCSYEFRETLASNNVQNNDSNERFVIHLFCKTHLNNLYHKCFKQLNY